MKEIREATCCGTFDIFYNECKYVYLIIDESPEFRKYMFMRNEIYIQFSEYNEYLNMLGAVNEHYRAN